MRSAEVSRKTKETDIRVKLCLDGSGEHMIETGVGFLDHMLTQIAVHGLFDLDLHVAGDLEVDAHHSVEDSALVLGQAFDQALGDRRGLVRMASATVPMDDALGFVAVDCSGRPYCVFQADWQAPQIGALPTSLVRHWFQSFAVGARLNLHAQLLYGEDDHHGAEALFKALGRALDAATQLDERRAAVPSSKGTLE